MASSQCATNEKILLIAIDNDFFSCSLHLQSDSKNSCTLLETLTIHMTSWKKSHGEYLGYSFITNEPLPRVSTFELVGWRMVVVSEAKTAASFNTKKEVSSDISTVKVQECIIIAPIASSRITVYERHTCRRVNHDVRETCRHSTLTWLAPLNLGLVLH